jgi:hypothetical protein
MTVKTAPAMLAVCAAALGAIAWASPQPDRVTDRGLYEAVAAQVIVPDCSDLQCFRVLVPWTLGRLPGSSVVRWKAYAVVANLAAVAAVWLLCVTLGLDRRAALMAAALSGFGFGSLYTLHDPYTADPLMFAIGPALTNSLLLGSFGQAAIMSVVGVLGKEFAAAPLYAFAAYAAVERRWPAALRALAGGNAAFMTWALLTLALMVRFGYTYGWNGIGSADFGHGAALALWLRHQSARGVAFAMFNEFGALYILAPAGFLLAPRTLRRLILVSLPIAAIFGYVEQPDRGLWNFHYLVVPQAALVLERVPGPLAWATIVSFAIGNLRVGAQLPIAGVARWAIALSLVLAVLSAMLAWRKSAAGRVTFDEAMRQAL